MRQISRYESPSQKRKRKRRVLLLSLLIFAGLAVLAPFVGNKLGLPVDLNLLHVAKRVASNFAAPVVTQNPSSPSAAPKASPSAGTSGEEETPDGVTPADPTPTPEQPKIRHKISMDLKFTEDWSRMDCTEVVEYHNPSQEALERIPFRIDSTPGNKLTWSRVIADGESCTTAPDAADPGIVWIQLPAPLADEASVRLTLIYSYEVGTEKSDFGRASQSARFARFYPQPCAYTNGAWVTEKAVRDGLPAYAERADYSVKLQTQDDYYVSATGNGSKTGQGLWSFEAENVRDFAIAIGISRREQDLTVGQASVHASAPHTAQKDRILASCEKILPFYETLMGPFSGQIDIYEEDISPDVVVHNGLILVNFGDSVNESTFRYNIALAFARLRLGVDVSGDKNAGALNELLCHYMASQYAISIEGEENAEAIYARCPETKALHEIVKDLPAGAFANALQEYRVAASNRYAAANAFVFPEEGSGAFWALADQYAARLNAR